MAGRSIATLWRAGAVLTLSALAAVAAALAFVRAADPPPSSELKTPNPEPIRRVVLSPERAAQEIERLGSGVLLRMPLADFDDLVRRACQGKAAQTAAPQLIAATYSARLKGEDLVGSAHWQVINPGTAPALLPVQPLNLALLKQPQFANRPAVIADFEARTPSLLLDTPGEHSVVLDWSARGDPRPGGLRFDLRFPAAVAGQVELDLPLDRSVTLDDPGPLAEAPLLAGPHAADAPGLRRWTVSCPGRSRVTFRVHSLAAENRGTAAVLCRQETTQVLRPGSLEARYRFELEAPRRGVGELLFECDDALSIYDVTVQGPQAVLKDWEVHRERGGGSRLTVRLAEPVQEATVLIDALAPLRMLSPAGEPAPLQWTSPNVRPLDVVHRGERLVLKIDPDLRAEDWQPGDFRLTEADEEPDAAGREFFQRLTLTGGGLLESPGALRDADVSSRRPSARLLAPGREYRARQLAWWQVRPAGELLTVQVTYEVTQGNLERLPLLLPFDWDVENVTVSPPGLLLGSRVDRDRGRPVLLVDLREPLRSVGRAGPPPVRRTATLTARLRPQRPRKTLTFPDTDPLGRHREGALAIDLDEQEYQAVPRTSAPPGEPAAKEDGPWGQQAPLFYYPYFGQPLTGTLELKPRAGQVRVRSSTDVFLAAGRPSAEVRLTLESEAGSSDAVEVFFSEPGPWEWRPARGGPPLRAERVEDVTTPLARLLARTPLDATALALVRSRGEYWRLTLPRPLRGSEQQHLVATRGLDWADGRVVVPLPVVVGAERFEGEVSLHFAGVQVEKSDLRDATPDPRSRHGPAARTFRYDRPPTGRGRRCRWSCRPAPGPSPPRPTARCCRPWPSSTRPRRRTCWS
jgi:hypothetical protein